MTVENVICSPFVNEGTRIYIHDIDPVGIVCTNLFSDNLNDYRFCEVDSFTWYGNGLNQLHIFLVVNPAYFGN